MSDTPETDAVKDTHFPNDYGASITFARSLERRLSEKDAEIARLTETGAELVAACEAYQRMVRDKGNEIVRLQAALAAGVVVPVKSLLAIRDALISGKHEEAYHQLYSAVPWDDPFNPWAEWEAMLAAHEKEKKDG